MAKNLIRSSQLITSFGPGSLVDFPDLSVIISGTDYWSYEHATDGVLLIDEPRLAAKVGEALGVPSVGLKKPPPSKDDDHGFLPNIAGWQFPNWFLVQRTSLGKGGFRRRRLVHANDLRKGKFPDPDSRRREEVVPVRFVRACEKGHVDDINWVAFVHRENEPCVRDLWVEERDTTGELSAIHVVCECGKERPLAQAAQRELKALGSCNGNRPWLGPKAHEKCGRPARLLLRGASNAYFAQRLSVISIPDLQAAIDDVVATLWEDFLVDIENLSELAKVRNKPTPKEKLKFYRDDELMAAIARRRAGTSGASALPIKQVEFDALNRSDPEIGTDKPDGIFFARRLEKAHWSESWMSNVANVVLVHRLREVVALVGFTRFEAVSNDVAGELDLEVESARLSLESPWVPATENRGEGIFLSFAPEAIAAWASREAVKERAKLLLGGFDIWKEDRKESKREFPGAAYVMLHSFAHLLMTAISLECGYPASSLRERIYAPAGAAVENRFGVLIYTGASDAEGTLGGLVEAGRKISKHVHNALSMGLLCSNDPVCASHDPNLPNSQHLSGAACHGCLYVGETSCEQQNQLLDRALVIPTMDTPDAAFFSLNP